MRGVASLVASRRWLLVLAAAALMGGAGCVIIPTPEMNTGRARRNITKETAGQLQPGTTTRREVMLALGEPDAVSQDETKLAYHTEKVCGLLILPPGQPAGLGGPLGRDRYLLLEFDANGRLLQGGMRAHRWAGGSDGASLLDHWRVSPAGIGCTNAVEFTPNRAPVRCQLGKWWRGAEGLTNSVSSQRQPRLGRLYLEESELRFITFAQFANDEPAVVLAFGDVLDCRLMPARYAGSRCLVVRGKDGQSHSFTLLNENEQADDAIGLGAACGFIQSRVKGSNKKD